MESFNFIDIFVIFMIVFFQTAFMGSCMNAIVIFLIKMFFEATFIKL